jgi:hypothetical protein
MKIFVLAALFTLALTVNGLAQKCKEYSAPGSSFAFCPPEGWTGKQEPGEKNLTFEAPTDKGGSPGVIVIKEASAVRDRVGLEFEVIKGTLQSKDLTDPRLVAAVDFDTKSGLHGTRLVFLMDNGGIPMVQVYAFIDGPTKGNYDLIITAPRDDKTIARLVDAAILSVRAK